MTASLICCSARLLLALALAVLAAGCAGGGPPRRSGSPERLARLVEASLAEGDIDTAEQLLVGGLRRWPEDQGLSTWSAMVHSLRGNRDDAVDQLRTLAARLPADAPPRREVAARIGVELFRSGRFGEARPWLRTAAKTDRALAALSDATGDLPVFSRRLGAAAVAELPLSAAAPPILECRLAGYPARMVVDTGASMTTVSRQLASRIGLVVSEPVGRAHDGTGEPIPASVAVVDSLHLGTLDMGAVPVLVIDAERLRLDRGEGEPIDGLVGFDLLSRLRFTFDPDRRSLVLGAPRGLLESPRVAACAHEQGCVLAPVRIGQHDLWFLVDSGASHSSLTQAGFQQIARGQDRGELTHRAVRGPGGTRIAILELRPLTLEVAGARFSDLTLPVVRRSPGPGAVLPVHGVLGSDLLLRCRTTFDSGSLRILAPLATPPR